MRKIVLLVLSAVLMISLASCGEAPDDRGLCVDWYPVHIFLKVTDVNGADLLDPENPDNMIDGTSITFKGETYEASRQWYETGRMFERPSTKVVDTYLYGLFLIKELEGFRLIFGEIDGAADMDEDLLVTLPNGTTGVIHYHCSNHNVRKLSCDRSWKFNGSESEGNIFSFVVSNK